MSEMCEKEGEREIVVEKERERVGERQKERDKG